MSTIAGWATPCRAPSTTPAGSASWAGPPSWQRSVPPWTATPPPACCSSTARAASASPRCSTRCAGGRWPAAGRSSASTAATWPGRSPPWRRPSRPWPTTPARCCSSTPTSCSPRSTAGSAASCCRRCPRAPSPYWPGGSHRIRHGRPTRAGGGFCAPARSPRWTPPRARTWWAASAPPPRPARGWRSCGRGHPLALVLLAEAAAQGRAPGRLDERPDLVAELCHVLVRDVPDPAHRTGLATCAHAYRTTEDLLAETVGERAPEVWAWLASRPFVRHSGTGLHLHDLMRDLVDTEFAQRNPQAYGALHRTIRAHATRRLRVRAHRHAVPRRHRAVPAAPRTPSLAAEFRQLRDEGVLPVEPGRAADHAEVRRAGRAGPRAPARARSPRSGSPRSPSACTWRAPTPASRGGPCSVTVPDAAGPPTTRPSRRRWPRSNGTARCGRASWSRSPARRRRAARAPARREQVLVGSVSSIIEWLTKQAAWRSSPPPTSTSGGRSWSTSGSTSGLGHVGGRSPSTGGTAGGCPLDASCG